MDNINVGVGGSDGLTLDTSALFLSSAFGHSTVRKQPVVSLPPSSSKMETGRHFTSTDTGAELSMSLGGAGGAIMPVSSNPNRVVDEMDFFSDEKKKMSAAKSLAQTDLDLKVRSIIKKEDLTINTGLHLSNAGSDQSTVDDGVSPNEDDKARKSELAVMQAELARINDENQKLKGMLNQVTTNYNALQMHLITLMQQRNQRLNNNSKTQQQQEVEDQKIESKKNDAIVPRQFLDLGPASNGGNEPSQSSTASGDRSSSSPQNVEAGSMDYRHHKTSLNKEKVPFDDEKCGREDSDQDLGWNPNKAPKLSSPKVSDQQAQEATMRKARVSVRARSEAPMITDGCQWRKYGQKMAKGNPCPRAYYRCTMATGCPVRKQVQRCADDRSILITTYEGTHNHPLPPAAMAMASTTSAAATMLLSGSMSSTDGLMNSNFLARTILPCSSSMATISASAPFPTVTLDLTNSPNPLQFQRPTPQFPLQFPSGTPSGFAAPPQPPSLPQVFGQNFYNQTKFSGLQLSPELEAAQPMLQPSLQPSFADTVSAATAAITADPNFTAALAAAITSIIGGNNNSNIGGTSANNNTSSNGNSSSNPSSSNLPAT